MLSIDTDEIRSNVICQQVAVSAATTRIFFAAFIDFCSSLMIDMLTEDMQEDFKLIRDKAVEAYRNAFDYSLLFGQAIQIVVLFPQCLKAVERGVWVGVKNKNKAVAPAKKYEGNPHG